MVDGYVEMVSRTRTAPVFGHNPVLGLTMLRQPLRTYWVNEDDRDGPRRRELVA